jgi:hypothetical protein
MYIMNDRINYYKNVIGLKHLDIMLSLWWFSIINDAYIHKCCDAGIELYYMIWFYEKIDYASFFDIFGIDISNLY